MVLLQQVNSPVGRDRRDSNACLDTLVDLESFYRQLNSVQHKIARRNYTRCISKITVQAKKLSLTHIEKQKLERELGMETGYVLSFSNRTFEEFFREVVGIEIYDSRYDLGSGSKANRMRAFWKHATEEQLRKLLEGLLEGWDLYSGSPMPDSARRTIQQILNRMGGSSNVVESRQNSNVAAQIDEDTSERLISDLLKVSDLPPQQRGYAFERFLKELFDSYDLPARASFRLTGEQIDGSFVLDNDIYLLEAKWQNSRTGVADLHTFEGKLGEKASWSRGLFVSYSGFSDEGIRAFGRGKRLVCMDGLDLSEMLRLKLSFVDVLKAKVRQAAETGNPFVSVRELF